MTKFFASIFKRYPTKMHRFLEILPGFISWTLILSPIWASLLFPYILAYFILFFDVFWLYKSVSLTITAYLASKKIRVNAVSGGLVDTDAMRAFPQQEVFKKEILQRTPAGRIGKPEDLAKVVTFLASDDAGWIYGQTLIADGGLSLI